MEIGIVDVWTMFFCTIDEQRSLESATLLPLTNWDNINDINDKSRMMGDCQVRLCESLGVKLPGSTRSNQRAEAKLLVHFFINIENCWILA